jgi:hypothetical protein
MNFEVFTPDVLKDVKPSKIAEYLRDHGWQEQNKISNKASIWIKQSSAEDNFEILLPLKPENPDFVRRIVEVLETLEVSEKLPQSQILDNLTDVNQFAKRIEREVINFALSFPIHYGSEAPISSLGVILSSLQDAVNGIAQSLAVQNEMINAQGTSAVDERLAKRRIPSNLAQEMELSALGSFKGSFGLKLVSTPSGLLGNMLIVNSLKELVDLIRIGSEIEGLREHLFKLRSSSARRYVNFLKSLSGAKAELNIEWGSTQPNYGGSARLTVETTKDALRAIRKMKTESIRNLSLSGRLTQGDVNTKHFKFEDDQGMEYIGYISDEAMSLSKILPLNQDCDVVMQETTISFFITDKVDKLYKIVELYFPGEARTVQGSLFN